MCMVVAGGPGYLLAKVLCARFAGKFIATFPGWLNFKCMLHTSCILQICSQCQHCVHQVPAECILLTSLIGVLNHTPICLVPYCVCRQLCFSTKHIGLCLRSARLDSIFLCMVGKENLLHYIALSGLPDRQLTRLREMLCGCEWGDCIVCRWAIMLPSLQAGIC